MKTKKEMRKNTRKCLNEANRQINKAGEGIALTMSQDFYLQLLQLRIQFDKVLRIGRGEWGRD